MFRYYQESEKSKWLPIADSDGVLKNAIEVGAKKLTILAVSERIDDDTARETLSYKGPMYFDIDSKNLEEAIVSVKLLVSKLKDLDVADPAINLFASGGKGFHVIIPANVFSTGRALKGMPEVYKEMALELYVTGMDFQVYCGGKGNSWRIENIEREDGNYRVPLTLEELDELETSEQYKELVSAPRHIPAKEANGHKSAGLAALMEAAKRRIKLKPKTIALIEDSVLAQFKEDPPQCVQMLAAYDVKKATKFNEVGMQMVIFITQSGAPNRISDSLVSRMADNGHSSKYDSNRTRLEHMKGLLGYFKTKSMKFSCNAMRGLCVSGPCDGCAIENKLADQEDEAEELGVIEKPGGYYRIGEHSDTKISSFIFQPVAEYIEESQSGLTNRRVGTMVDMMRDEIILSTFMITEDIWSSRSQMISETKGILNTVYTGNDADAQKIKSIVFGGDKEMGEIIQVNTAGIHTQKVGKKSIRVYVEQGMSINQFNITGTHHHTGVLQAPPRLKGASIPEVGDKEVAKAISNLMNINSKVAVAQIIGWFAACHLKNHFMVQYSQFPLLSLWGNAGCGKTMTAALMAWINGLDFSQEDSVNNLSSATPFALMYYCSGTTTLPRLLDEYNKSKMTRRSYNFCGEVMKATWNGQVISRGTINQSSANGKGRSGASVDEMQMSGPLVVMSEQAPDMPALQQRSIQIMLKEADREGKDVAFEYANDNRDQLLKLAKALTISALTTDVEWIQESMAEFKKVVPHNIIDRPKYSYQLVLTGLKFLKKVCDDLQLGVSDQIDDLTSALVEHLENEGDEISRSKHRTEVDAVMEHIGTMIAMTKSGNDEWLVEGKHYAVDSEKQLYLDLPIVHAFYMRYVRVNRGNVIIESISQFGKLMQQEKYFVSAKALVPEMQLNRPLYQLNLDKMYDKGLDISLFQ